MAPTDGRDSSASGPDESNATVFAHQTSPDRTVFSERGNPDGWIAISADVVTSLDR
ncbi:hypothetical protein SAMN04488063_1147 [Halopelagius inordinatus]|uniref:Uncharacterized protein n=1 Tax=Halopelagius inordinatus TaxID=553467 RepID=A0A1I2NDG9_9EURY|nr:hypothetical protein [Halopelagius inordinatus]SFG01914.1 hypothetical protein SAMN04488063_1147 [Halopelagius inordinatus]